MILLLVMIGLCLDQGSTQPGNEPEWKRVGQSMAADFSYDVRHLDQLPGGYQRVQFRLVYRTDTEEGREASEHITKMTTQAMEGKQIKPVAYAIIMVDIDCTRRRFRQRQEKVYARGGELIEAVPGQSNPEWQSAPPDNVYTALLKDVCAGK